MAKNVQIRNVDDATYEVPQQQTMAEWLDKADEFRRRHGGVSRKVLDEAFEEARAERDARFDHL